MALYTLVYFDTTGRAETTRTMFRLKNVKFEDKRLTQDQWKELKSKTPYEQLPILYVEGWNQPIAQSRAIERFVAKEVGLYGKDRVEETRIDSIIDAITEANDILVRVFFAEDKEQALKTAMDVKWPEIMNKIEKNVGEGGHAVGSELTWADADVYSHVAVPASHNFQLPIHNYPKLNAIYDKVDKLIKNATA